MRISYIGNFHQPWSTETYIAKTLENMGHEVIRLQENELTNSMPGADMLLWTRTWPGRVSEEMLNFYKSQHIPTASYHLDFYVGLPREANLDTDLFWRTDHVFQIDGDPGHMKVFKDKGINAHYLPAGVYKKDCFKGSINPRFDYDIVFLGGAEHYPANDWPYRMQLINFLRDAYGDSFHVFPDNGKRLWGRDMNDLYASSKIAIGDSMCFHDFMQENAWSDRIYETTGRGGFMIHPFIKGLEKEFKAPNEIVYYHYGDFNELKQLINFYLNNSEIREKIRNRGMQRTKHEHTYENRLEELLRVVNATT